MKVESFSTESSLFQARPVCSESNATQGGKDSQDDTRRDVGLLQSQRDRTRFHREHSCVFESVKKVQRRHLRGGRDVSFYSSRIDRHMRGRYNSARVSRQPVKTAIFQKKTSARYFSQVACPFSRVRGKVASTRKNDSNQDATSCEVKHLPRKSSRLSGANGLCFASETLRKTTESTSLLEPTGFAIDAVGRVATQQRVVLDENKQSKWPVE